MKYLTLFSCFIIGFSLFQPVRATELIIGFAPEKPPFVFASIPYKEKHFNLKTKHLGIQIDVVIAALEGSEYTFKPVYASNQRIIRNVQQKLFDGGEMAGPKLHDIYYSGTVIEFRNYAITRKSDRLKVKNIRDLEGLSLVAWQGANQELGNTFARVTSNNPNYYEHPSLKGQCMMFFGKRVQVIVIAKNIFLWWKKELAPSFNTSHEVVYHPIFGGVNGYSMGFASQKVRDAFDVGLKRIKDDGTYQQIFRSYLE